MQNTTHYNLKKPDYNDFADIQDINDNMDTIDEKLAAPDGDGRDQTVSFTDADLDSGITSFPTFLTKIVSGMKLAKFLRDFKAGMAYVLHVGDLINNATCTESGKALDARMGKTLQDQITSLNDSLTSFVTPAILTSRNDSISHPETMQFLCAREIQADGLYIIQGYMNYVSARPVELKVARITTDGGEQMINISTFSSDLSSSAFITVVDYAKKADVRAYRLYGKWSSNVTGCVAELNLKKLLA